MMVLCQMTCKDEQRFVQNYLQKVALKKMRHEKFKFSATRLYSDADEAIAT